MSKSETEVITVSYHDLLNLYGDGERLEAEHREFVYVQQPNRYKTPQDIAEMLGITYGAVVASMPYPHGPRADWPVSRNALAIRKTRARKAGKGDDTDA